MLVAVPLLAALVGPLVAGDTAPRQDALPSQPPGGDMCSAPTSWGATSWRSSCGRRLGPGSALGALLIGMAAGCRWVCWPRAAARARRDGDARPGPAARLSRPAGADDPGGDGAPRLVLAGGGRRVAPGAGRGPPGPRAALAPGSRTVVEALRMQGHGWAYVHLRHLARELAAPLATDAGGRFSVVLYLLASANFLGLACPRPRRTGRCSSSATATPCSSSPPRFWCPPVC
ncbi:ABC transporter permease [Streptomyces sp. M19]